MISTHFVLITAPKKSYWTYYL